VFRERSKQTARSKAMATVQEAYDAMTAGTDKTFFVAGFQITKIICYNHRVRGVTFHVFTTGGDAIRRGFYEIEAK